MATCWATITSADIDFSFLGEHCIIRFYFVFDGTEYLWHFFADSYAAFNASSFVRYITLLSAVQLCVG